MKHFRRNMICSPIRIKPKRRRLIRSGIVAFLGLGFLKPFGKVSQRQKVKMLSKDGRLMEVDISDIQNSSKKKASHSEICQWIHR